jgi:carbonic anhydrase
VYRFHYEELDKIENEKERFNRFVELNVTEQVLDLAKTSIIQNAWKKEQQIHIHGWVYDIHDGLINDLNVTLKDNKSLNQVYQLSI